MHQKVLLSVIDLRGTSGFHAGDGRDRFYSSKMVEGDHLIEPDCEVIFL